MDALSFISGVLVGMFIYHFILQWASNKAIRDAKEDAEEIRSKKNKPQINQ